jgi:probable HAF family extracellular repeat protein
MYKLLIVLALALVLALAATGSGPAAASKPTPTPSPTPSPTPNAAYPYTVTDLGSLGYGLTYGLGINNNGQITGYSYLSTEFQVTCPPQKYGGPKQCFEHPYHAFLWSNGTMTDLGTLGGHFSTGTAINLSGEVIGQADTTTGGSSFLWNGKTMTALTALSAAGINDSGQISGGCQQACIDTNGTITLLPNPSGLTCNGGQINNNGDVIGGCSDATSNATSKAYVVLWHNGTPTDLGNLGGPEIVATALNNSSPAQVTGYGQDSTYAQHAFLWSNGTITDIGAAFYPDELYPTSINDSGVIVGGPFIWRNGTLQNLNNLIPPGSGVTINDATGINDKGQIVVNGSSTSGGTAFLLTPVS